MLVNQSVKNEKPQDLAVTKSQGKVVQSYGSSNSTTKVELNSSKARYEKGLELYRQGKISITGDGLFKVSGYYHVDTSRMRCECPDFKTHGKPCKHIFACLLFVKNRGKQKVEHLNGFVNSSSGKPETQPNFQPESKEASNKHQESHSKDFDRQATITRLATINSAIEALKTHRKPVELADILSLAAQLEKWVLSN